MDTVKILIYISRVFWIHFGQDLQYSDVEYLIIN